MKAINKYIIVPIASIVRVLATITQNLSRFILSQADWVIFSKTFKCREDDIYIVTYPKSGTTWMQMILYQLTTDGDMGFRHISTIIPHIDNAGLAQAMKKKLDDAPSPRVFKTHLPYQPARIGPGRYIYVARNGMDVALSYYAHHQIFFNFSGSFDQFYQMFLRGKVVYWSWFNHVRGWWEHKDDANVLFLRYEDMKEDLPGAVRKIAAFCNIELDDAKLNRVVERSSFKFMKQYQEKFDLRNELAAVRFNSENDFIRKGEVGGWRNELSPEQKTAYRELFNKTLHGIGLDDYLPHDALENKQNPKATEPTVSN